MREQFQFGKAAILRVGRDAGEGYVDAISRGAAHDAGYRHRGKRSALMPDRSRTCSVNRSTAVRIFFTAALVGDRGSRLRVRGATRAPWPRRAEARGQRRVKFRLPQQGLVGGKDQRRVAANLHHVHARRKRTNRRVGDARVVKDAAHLHVVGDDQPLVADLPDQDLA